MSTRKKAPKPSTPVVAKGSQLQQVKHDDGLAPQTGAPAVLKQQVIQQSAFQGPIPHPDIFRKYGEIVADAPERILRVFEQDSAHAREIKNAVLEAQKCDNRRVHWMAWSLIAGGYALSALFAYWDKDMLAGIILTTTLAGTIAGFFQNKMSDKADDDDKAHREHSEHQS